jgi:hypothetical protein
MSEPRNKVDLIIQRIEQVEKRLESLEIRLTEDMRWHRDHPLCPQPGLCVHLDTQLKALYKSQGLLSRQLDETRRLVWVGVGLVTVISLAFGVVAPFFINQLLKMSA